MTLTTDLPDAESYAGVGSTDIRFAGRPIETEIS